MRVETLLATITHYNIQRKDKDKRDTGDGFFPTTRTIPVLTLVTPPFPWTST
jgi:hypothetical protein